LEEVVLEQCGNDRAAAELDTHRHRRAIETLAQPLGPSLNGPGPML
jgi:hypothetical protein